MGTKTATLSSDATVTTSETTLLSVSLTAGTWIIIGMSSANNGAVNAGDCYFGIVQGSTNIGRTYVAATSSTYFVPAMVMAFATLTSTATIKFVAKAGASSFTAPSNNARTKLVAFRVA